jgi:hypothetical protein
MKHHRPFRIDCLLYPVRTLKCDGVEHRLIAFVKRASACWTLVGALAKGMMKISYAGYRFPPEVIHPGQRMCGQNSELSGLRRLQSVGH